MYELNCKNETRIIALYVTSYVQRLIFSVTRR